MIYCEKTQLAISGSEDAKEFRQLLEGGKGKILLYGLEGTQPCCHVDVSPLGSTTNLLPTGL